MGANKFETSRTDGIHFKLGQMAGEWEGVTKTYFEEGKPPTDESPMHGSIRPILGGRFMLHEYQGSLSGKPFDGFALYGHSLDLGKFQAAWVDSFHMGTGILFSEASEPDKYFSVLGSYRAGDETWGWSTEIEMPDADHLTITSKNFTPAGEPAGGTTTVYSRVSK